MILIEFVSDLKVKVLALPNEQERTIVNVATVTSSETELSPENNTSSAVIQVQPLFIPNVITPNGDGSNDRFEIKGLGRFVSNEIVIINRWGDSVYQRVNYQNDWSANGLSNGTYFYVLVTIDEAGKRHEFKGWIQVITE
jgi:gliding motility-associated-like protein